MELTTALTIILIHWFADFVCQTDEMAQNKSKSNYWLTAHILTYTLMSMMAWPLFVTPYNAGFTGWLLFGLITGLAHFATDYITSRQTSKLYAKGDYHNFFVVIGFDQVLHYTQLFLTYKLITSL